MVFLNKFKIFLSPNAPRYLATDDMVGIDSTWMMSLSKSKMITGYRLNEARKLVYERRVRSVRISSDRNHFTGTAVVGSKTKEAVYHQNKFDFFVNNGQCETIAGLCTCTLGAQNW